MYEEFYELIAEIEAFVEEYDVLKQNYTELTEATFILSTKYQQLKDTFLITIGFLILSVLAIVILTIIIVDKQNRFNSLSYRYEQKTAEISKMREAMKNENTYNKQDIQ